VPELAPVLLPLEVPQQQLQQLPVMERTSPSQQQRSPG
jgi:hypothetical protein